MSEPASPAQERMWLLEQLRPGAGLHVAAVAARLRGALDRAALEGALRLLAERRPALRTTLALREGRLERRLLPALAPALDDVPVEAPFDLGRGPLFRAGLRELAPGEHLLTLAAHAAACDRGSLGLLVVELGAGYAALRAGARPAPPPAPPREPVLNGALRARAERRRAGLRAFPPLLELPADRPRPAEPSFGCAVQPLRIEAPAPEALAAFAVLLSRHARQRRFLVGVPVPGNTVVVPVDLSDDPGFDAAAARAAAWLRAAEADADLPVELLTEGAPDLRHNPLFQVRFSAAAEPELRLDGLDCLPVAVAPRASTVDLALSPGQLEYSTDLFDPETAERLARRLATLLEAGRREPELPVSRLPILDAAERRRIVVDWGSGSPPLTAACLHHRFEAQARRTPDRPALAFAGAQLSYRELDARANRLAHHLVGLGVEPDSIVAIACERSFALIVAILGVLKSGGALLPIDLANPPDRIAFMLRDSAARVLVTGPGGRPPAGFRGSVVPVDMERLAGEPDTPPATRVLPRHLAYVIYTSGSTGRPKGVAVPHEPLVNLLAWHATAGSGLAEPARVLQLTSASFDVAYQEIFSTLCAGGRLTLVTEDERRDSARLARIVEEEAIERVFTSFSPMDDLARALVERGVRDRDIDLVAAGEQVRASPAIVALCGTRGRLHDHYGPTETAIIVTAARLLPPAAGWPELPSIGRPLPNVTAAIVDEHLEPVPIGVPGELVIGGVAPARGYLGRPDLTAERFVPDPSGRGPGARVYRTGDAARFAADGSIHYLGRLDAQLKLRGLRIEPGEIEGVLSRHPGVQAAAVAIREIAGQAALVAYLVRAPAARLDAADLRARLQAALPDYMVPSRFLLLERLPLTTSGKVDRRSLPDPGAAAVLSRAYRPPGTETEVRIARIWSEHLGMERIGLDDNFFELGGQSMTAAGVAARVSEILGAPLAVGAMFQHQELHALAAEVDRLRRSDDGRPRLSRVPRSERTVSRLRRG